MCKFGGGGGFQVLHVVDFQPVTSKVHWSVFPVLQCSYAMLKENYQEVVSLFSVSLVFCKASSEISVNLFLLVDVEHGLTVNKMLLFKIAQKSQPVTSYFNPVEVGHSFSRFFKMAFQYSFKFSLIISEVA